MISPPTLSRFGSRNFEEWLAVKPLWDIALCSRCHRVPEHARDSVMVGNPLLFSEPGGDWLRRVW